MFIDNKPYPSNLTDVDNMRYILNNTLYKDTNAIESLKQIITRYIDCLGIEFSPVNFTFTIKIKKTAMRKMSGFKHMSDYYYQTIPNIFREFISSHEQNVLQGLRTIYPDPYSALQYYYNNISILANLCHLTCISDNIVIIKL